MSATLVITRPNRFVGRVVKLKVMADGVRLGTVRNGGRESFSIEPGKRTLTTKLGAFKALPLEVELEEGERLSLEHGLHQGGLKALSYLYSHQRTDLRPLLPHRGIMLFVIAFLGVLGIYSFLGGRRDLELMKEGMIDQKGKGLTTVATWLGLASFASWALFAVLIVLGVALS